LFFANLQQLQWCVVVTTTELVLLHSDGLGVGVGEMSVVVRSLRVAADAGAGIFCTCECGVPWVQGTLVKRLRWGCDSFDVRGA
jgi:hypothetical protein